MVRLMKASLTLAAVLLYDGWAFGQTEKPCLILFENLSRETFKLRDVSVLLADGTKKEYTGFWTYYPGDRATLSFEDSPVEGRQVFYTVELPDGTSSARQSTTKWPLTLGRDNVILQRWDDDQMAGLRKDEKKRKLSKAEATYRYWNTVHGIHLEESFDAIQNVGFLELAKLTGYLREMAKRIDDLDTDGVDDDAVAAAKAYAAVLREQVKVMNSRGGAKTAAMVGELFQLKVDTFTKMLDENQQIAGKAEDVFQFMRSRRKALEKRYDARYPHLIPPIAVGLSPFLISTGFYVNLLNTSGEDMKDVRIRYRDAAGKVRFQSVSKRFTFNSAAGLFDFTQLNPQDVTWRVDTGEWITIEYEGGAYSYPTDKLIKR